MAIQVVEHTPSKLVIVVPPLYFLGLIFLLASLLATGFIFLSQRHRDLLAWPRPLLFVTTASFMVIGLAILSSQSIATLSRESGQLTITNRVFGLNRSRREFQLSQISHAAVHAGGRGRSLVVVLHSGRVIMLTSFTSQGGQPEAANAINDFLGIHTAR